MCWLRTTLAQRHVDHHRRTHREAPLEAQDPPAPPTIVAPSAVTMHILQTAIEETLQALSEEGRFLLSAYFLDQRTLRHIAQFLRVHEATVSRKLKRLSVELREGLLKRLRSTGLSRGAAEKPLGTDPCDLTVNLRNLLQHPRSQSFSNQAGSTEPMP